MDRIDLKALKEIELGILIYVDKICRDNGIQYFLDSGTLLGAVRHHGFIPWDDDIDIAMLRPDYERFKRVMIGRNGRYQIKSSENCEGYCYPFAKVVDLETVLHEKDSVDYDGIGVYIDIFPLDKVPKDKEIIRSITEKQRRLINILRYCRMRSLPRIKSYNPIAYVISFIFYSFAKIHNPKALIKKLDDISLKYKDSEEDYCWKYTIGEWVFERETMEKTILLQFEEHEFPGPIGYDKYLTALYGNYMKEPPKEEQVSNHEFEAYYRI